MTGSNSGYLPKSFLHYKTTTRQSNGKKVDVLSLNLVASALRMAGLCISRVGWATLYFCHHPTALYILCHPPSFGLSYQSMNEHDIFRDICDKNRYLHYIFISYVGLYLDFQINCRRKNILTSIMMDNFHSFFLPYFTQHVNYNCRKMKCHVQFSSTMQKSQHK